MTITRGGKTTRYTVRLNTYVTPITIDFFPEEAGADMVLGLVQLTRYGEMLLRTDFTSKRPARYSTKNVAAAPAKRYAMSSRSPNKV